MSAEKDQLEPTVAQVQEKYLIRGRFLKQPVGEFFVGVVPASILRRIAREDIRRLEEKSSQKHIGIERPLSPKRVSEIRTYIGTVDATFPNSIIVAMRAEDVEQVDHVNHTLLIPVRDNLATLIDGLHRLAGFDESNWSEFELIVSIFFDLEEEDKALIFSTINLKQTKVTKSLVYDLFDVATTRSPYKTGHDIAKALNYADGDSPSPFYHRIKLLGTNPKWNNEEVIYKGILTQGTFVERLVKLISRDPTIDRDRLKREQPIERFPDEVETGLVFRQFFAEEQDDVILKVMLNYFEAVRDTFPDEWENRENPLSRTIGYAALMKLLAELCKAGLRMQSLEKQFFRERLDRARGRIQFSFGRYSPSGAGESDLFADLRRLVIDNA